jgi:DNA-binding transcriptional MerR regulator
MTGVPIKTIRYYAEIDLLPPATTTQAGYRLYSPAEIWRLELVRTLRHVGFGLDDIRRILGGDLDVASAIGWQLEVLEGQLSHLQRLRDLLRQAQTSLPDEERSLQFLHAMGAAVTRDVEQRRRFLASKLHAALGGDVLPPAWAERLLQTETWSFPAEPTAEQAVAWAELVALLDDPAFVTAMRRHTAPFWETMRQHDVDADWWHAGMVGIGERALAAFKAGAPPDGPVVQAIVRDWAGVFAQALGQPCDAAFLRQFGAIAPNFVDGRARRVYELLERAGRGGDAPSQLRVQQLLLDGLHTLVDAIPE